METTLEKTNLSVTEINRGVDHLALVAGEGELPVYVAQNAKKRGTRVTAFCLDKGNVKALKAVCETVYEVSPGIVEEPLEKGRKAGIRHILFAGKVNKWIIIKGFRMDKRAREFLASLVKRNDDSIMLKVMQECKKEGLTVLNQSDYLDNLFLPSGTLSQRQPTAELLKDITFGFQTAKEMGRLDIGQSVVVKDQMVIAVEAIEGTDQCIKRSAKWTHKKGGVLVKVAKPDQDQRFDVPTVGLRTLKSMKKAGLTTLAVEANETLILDPEAMTAFVDKHNMIFTIISQQEVDAIACK